MDNRQNIPDIELRDVSVSYGNNVLIDGQNLLVEHGQRIAIIGESGQGKTTAVDIIRGHRRPTSGAVCFLGRPIHYGPRALSRLWSSMPLVSQEDNSGKTIPSYLTALENVSLVMRLRGADRKQARSLAANMLERVGLGRRMHTKPGKLSGGERQRVAVARALVADSRAVLADEPTAALDPRTSQEVLQLLTDSGRTLVIVTHEAMLVAPYVDRMLLLQDGVFHDVTNVAKESPMSLFGLSDYSQLLTKRPLQQASTREVVSPKINCPPVAV